ADCSKADLQATIRTIKEMIGPSTLLMPHDQERVNRLQQIIDDTLGVESPAHIRGRRAGDEVWLDLARIPLDRLDELLKALLKP
ncbi:MAG: hypothetical protein HY901_06360, partial [Deltaproteobacteria bacterium]|nr:hypothetical protein [Deltaproteobacteria bacterium]